MALFKEERLKHLRVLGLKYDATEDDIKKTYKKLALRYHPDKCQNDPNSTRRFQELSAAYYGLKKIIEKERKKCCCNCGFQHYDVESDCSDFYDSDDDGTGYSQEDEDLLDFFRRIFMDVFSEFVFRKKFQSKKRRRDTFNVEEDDEDESFFEFLSKKFRSEGRNTTDDYVLTEEDLKRFQSYDDWQKARDPSKPHNRCKRRAIQKSRRRFQKEELKQPSKKQLKTEQLRKEKELKEIRDQLLKNLDEKKEKELQKIQKGKKKGSDSRSKIQGRSLKSPERLEIEEQLVEARKKELELEENLRRLEARELKKEKKQRKTEKKKAKKQQNEAQGNPLLQLKSEDFTEKLLKQDFSETKYSKKNLSDRVKLDKGFSRPVSKYERDKGLQELMDRVKKKRVDAVDTCSDTVEGKYFNQYTEPRVSEKEESNYADSSQNDGNGSGSSRLKEHLEAYHELMKLQPKRHTEQQLRQERSRIRDAQLRTQQHELNQLRNAPASQVSEGDHSLRRDEFLKRQRERERLRNEEEAMEISKETTIRRHQGTPVAPVSRRYYESISYQEKHAQFEHPTQTRQVARPCPTTVPVVENPIKREIPNPESTWSQVVNSETPWGQRSRKQLEIKNLLPHDADEEEEMLQQALALSMQMAEEENKREQLYDQLEQAEIDHRVMEAASKARKPEHNGTHQHRYSEPRPPITKFPLSDKFKVYPGCNGSMPSPVTDLETKSTWSLPSKKFEVTKMCRPHPSRKDTWSLCPGEPGEDDWSFSHAERQDPVVNERDYYLERPCEKYDDNNDDDDDEDDCDGEEMEVVAPVTEDVVVVNSKWKDTSTHKHGYDDRYENSVDVFRKSAPKSHRLRVKPVFALEAISGTELPANSKMTADPDRSWTSNRKEEILDQSVSLDAPSVNGQSDKHHLVTNKPSYPEPKCIPAPKPHQTDRKTLHVTDKPQLQVAEMPLNIKEVETKVENSHSNDGQQFEIMPVPFGDQSMLNGESLAQRTEHQNEKMVTVVRIEAETNTDPIAEPPPPSHPEMHDSFTQTKVSTGFVGGYWDSSSNNMEKIPIPNQPQLSSQPDPKVLEKIPKNSFVPPEVPRGPQSHQGGKGYNYRQFKAPSQNHRNHSASQPKIEPVENWEDNLLETFSAMNMENPCVSERAESSIAVNTDHDNTTIPRLPVVSASSFDQPVTTNQGQPRLTDDQKLSQSGSTTETSLPCGLPAGLPPHLVQAYMEYVSKNEQPQNEQNKQESTPPIGQTLQEVRAHVPSPPNLPTMRPFGPQGHPGFVPQMWSPLFPWMMAGPMMPQPIMSFCPPVFPYTLQHQMETNKSNNAQSQPGQRQPQQHLQTRSCPQDPKRSDSPDRKQKGDVSEQLLDHFETSVIGQVQADRAESSVSSTSSMTDVRRDCEGVDTQPMKENWDAPHQEHHRPDRNNSDMPYHHPYNQRYRTNLPPRFQRQKRLELKKKIQTFISEIKKDSDEYIQTEIGDEENRISM